MDNNSDVEKEVRGTWDFGILYNYDQTGDGGDRLMNERDPDGIDQHTTGAKLDSGKPDASMLLMFGRALLAVAEVSTFGAKKYTRGGWQTVANGQERYTAAELRHMCKEHYEDYDADSGLLHLAHGAWNALARLEMKLRELDNETHGTTSCPDSTPKL